MKDRILKIVKDFVEVYKKGDAPFLLGFSGGPDSLALLHLLLECRRFFPLNLHLAHVDHGWRLTSGQEAGALREMASALGLPFYLKRLPLPAESSNLEEMGRKARLAFFKELCQREGFQGVFLAHQADDQAETVFKRIMEGSGMLGLRGLKKLCVLEGIPILRPLLEVRKKELLSWIARKGVVGIDDPSNRDPRYLRSRMRVQIFPLVEAAFGKQSVMNLVHLGSLSEELVAYFERKTAKLFEEVKEGEDGVLCLNLNAHLPMEKLEFLTLCRGVLEKQGIFFSRTILEQAFEALNTRIPLRKFSHRGRILSVDRGVIYLDLKPEKAEN